MEKTRIIKTHVIYKLRSHLNILPTYANFIQQSLYDLKGL